MRRRWPAAFFLAILVSSSGPHASAIPSSLKFGFSPIDFVSPANFKDRLINKDDSQKVISHFCSSLNHYFLKYKWRESPCAKVRWRADLTTKNGHPLIYAVFGTGNETTLLLGGVHADELTPIPVAFRFAQYLSENSQTVSNGKTRVIVAPLVNPDGFMRNTPTRTNANGVDLNRNFYTMDWYSHAKRLWIERRSRAAKHFPGYFPNSEIEVLFQIQLMDQFNPDKILSIHAPLGFLDYDGPGDRKPQLLSRQEKMAKRLVYSISEKSMNYRVVDYNFFPGSLGNYAGNERHVPTVTLELETTNPDKAEAYWRQFLPGMLQSITYPFTSQPLTTGNFNATMFSKIYGPQE
jgi:murein peptide amidase A